MYVEKMDVRLQTKGDVYAKTSNSFHSYHGPGIDGLSSSGCQ